MIGIIFVTKSTFAFISELVSTNKNEPTESRLNLTEFNLIELNQDPDQCSEEPKANFAQKRKAPVHNPIIFVHIYIYVLYLSVVIILYAHLRS